MSQLCPSGHDNADSASFCSTCGARLASATETTADLPLTDDAADVLVQISPPSSRPRWLVPAIIAGAVVAALGLAIGVATAASNAAQEAERQEAAELAAEEAERRANLLPNAAKVCTQNWEDAVSDGGLSLFLDNRGDDFGSGELTFSEVDCILERLDVSDGVCNAMVSTRSLDGRQTGEWGDYEASWTYHPDDGLDIIIELVG